MLHIRSVSVGGPLLAAILLISASSAIAASAAPVSASPVSAVPAALSTTAGPAASVPRPASTEPRSAVFVNDDLSSDSCTQLSNGTSSHFTCLATGYLADAGTVQPLALTMNEGGAWGGLGTLPVAPRNNVVNLPSEVSCASPDELRPTCMIVGEHYRNVRTAAQFAEVWDGGGTVVAARNPRGSTWSELQDVSCPTITFCLMVGQAGTSRKTSRGIEYFPHATAYSWNGVKVRQLSGPAPAHARNSELGGLACATTTTCMAVGNYTDAQGKWKTYSAAWNTGKWHVELARNVRGQASTTFNAVACPSATTCMAVGESQSPGEHPFAEDWRNGTWRMSATPTRQRAALASASCPTATRCFAAGWQGNRGLIETWNGVSWRAQKAPTTAPHFSGDGLLHVSCVATTACEAVGYRFNPKVKAVKRTFRTLAAKWNGHRWELQATINQ